MTRPALVRPAAAWSPPLDRLVTFHSGQTSLHEALEGLAMLARVRLSYSSDFLNLGRPVCVALDSVPAGVVLATLLEGAAVQAVSVGGDHIALTPGAPAFVAEPAWSPVMLEQISVTGSAADDAARRAQPVAVDVVEGDDFAERSTDGAISHALNASVPGMWLWAQSPTSLLTQYGSVRGASSFGLTYPKVYIDGIQVANPLLLTQLTPEAIDHVEIIRGPQGAALYGADAISGVTNIVTRKGTSNALGRARLRTGVGFSSSDFTGSPSLGQDHVLTVNGGSSTRSLGANIEVGSSGAYIPGAYQRHVGLISTARGASGNSVLTGVVRLFGEQAGSPASPLLPAPVPPVDDDDDAQEDDDAQSVLQYTAGATARLADGVRFTHTLLAGVDGYTLSGVPEGRNPVPSLPEAALAAAEGGAARGTLRVTTVAHVIRSPVGTADLTLVGEQSVLRQWAPETEAALWRSNTGISAQLNASILGHTYFTGGMRLERASGMQRMAALPMLGMSWIAGNDNLSLKLRGAFGTGIRWPEPVSREPRAGAYSGITAGLEPERQSGIEGGFDLTLGSALMLQVTRFDQVASGLIQRVMTPLESDESAHRVRYQMQNVGEISNRGWELQGVVHRGSFSLTGTVSLADSRVRRLADGYTGDLAPGDRTLDVPARTFGLSAAWSDSRWAVSLTGSRAENWISYDRVGLLQALTAGGVPSRDQRGAFLRNYWTSNGGVTHLRATLARSIRPGVVLTITGDNLLDQQRGEPDNLTVLPGRTVSVGVRAEF